MKNLWAYGVPPKEKTKKGKLETVEIKKFENIDVWMWDVKEKFDIMFNKLEQYVKDNNSLQWQTTKDAIQNDLGKWCNIMRYLKKIINWKSRGSKNWKVSKNGRGAHFAKK